MVFAGVVPEKVYFVPNPPPYQVQPASVVPEAAMSSTLLPREPLLTIPAVDGISLLSLPRVSMHLFLCKSTLQMSIVLLVLILVLH
jgi:hypothetical protein